MLTVGDRRPSMKSRMFRLFLLLICVLPCRATAAAGGQSPGWSWHDAGTKSLRISSALPEVTLEAGAKGAFVDNRAYQIGKKRFRLLYQVFDSNAENPIGRCGAGREIHLFVYEMTSPTPVERGRILIGSCLHNVSLASQNSGRPGSESDFSSVIWRGDGLTIQWWDGGATGGVASRYVLRDGRLVADQPGAGTR